MIYALEAGAKVLGASSMGALRASELDIYGMEGIGRSTRPTRAAIWSRMTRWL
ncbi:MAG: TfuA-like protein [Comamonadaceae bacterium]|nr:TfuA-like protein [Comamonadaceae bacterium]